MEAWKENFTLVRQLSRKQSKRFGVTFLLQENSSKKLVVFKLSDKSNIIGYQQLKNEKELNFILKGLPTILDSFENETQFGIYKKYEEGEIWISSAFISLHSVSPQTSPPQTHSVKPSMVGNGSRLS